MPAPIFCFDLDGTLVDAQGRIHPRDLAILAGEFEACFIPATGRPLPSVRRMFAQHGLFASQPLPFPLALFNGGLLYLPGEKLLSAVHFPQEVQDNLLSLAQARPHITFWLLDEREIFELWPSLFSIQAAERFDFAISPYTQANTRNALSKVMCISPDPNALHEVQAEMTGLGAECFFSLPEVLEVNPHGVNKGDGVKTLMRALGLSNNPLYAAGDGDNDLALFAAARRAFAPRSSPEHIRRAASRLLDTEREGVLLPMMQDAGVPGPPTE